MGKRGRKGQITLFVIIGIVVLAAIVITGIILVRKASTPVTPTITPELVGIEKCIEGVIDNALGIILPQGGYISPETFYLYKGIKIAYLCYHGGFFKPCINQEPLYLEHVGKEIISYSEDRVLDCFYAFEQEYKDRGYNVQSSPMDYTIKIEPNRIKVLVNKTIIFTKGSDVKRYENFNFNIANSIYELARVAIDITDQESKYCNFEYVGYMLTRPDFEITKENIDKEIEIYTVKDKKTEQTLKLAIRSCAFPPD